MNDTRSHSGAPFVLRDSENPKQNIRTYAGISAERLEQMESRLKDDVINEAKKCGGLILVHDELGRSSDGRSAIMGVSWFGCAENERIVPAWISAEQIKTTKEIFDQFRQDGYRISYTRIPISPEQRPEDKYLDEYVNIVRGTNMNSALIFNCGLGVGRSK